MKALVLGGNRFFGKRLVENLLNKNASVTLLNRGQRDDGFGNRVERIVLDRKNLDGTHPALANKTWDVVYDQICYDAVEAKVACDIFSGKTNRYIFTSSQSVYGPGSDLQESNFNPLEHQFTEIADRQQDYGEAKRQAEATFFRYAPFEICAVRFPIVLGPDDYTERLKFHVDHVREGKAIYFPNIEAKISFIQSSDAAAFLEHLAHHSLTGPVNACSEHPVALKQVIQWIEQSVKKQANISGSASEGDPSPFGIESDWYMNAQSMRNTGFHVPPISEWLPQLCR